MLISSLRRVRPGRWIVPNLSSVTPRNRKVGLATAALLLVLVVSFEWFSELEFSLGIFYVFPIIAAATVLNRPQVIAAALLCAYVRGQFTGGFTPLEFWLRFAMATLAYSGVGLFVVELNRNRRTVLAAFTRLKLEKELRHRAEDQLRILAESSPAAIITLNERAEVLAANRAAHEMLGFEYPNNLLGKNIEDHVPVFAGALRVTPGERQIRTSASSWAKRANGVTFPVATWFSTYGEGENRHLAGILVDSSEEVRERERDHFQHMLDYNRLLAGAVSHEIRNMCSAIRVVTSNLSQRPELKRDADFGALTSLVNSLASIASFDLDQGKQPEAGWISLNDVFEQLRVVIENDWSDADGTIEWNVQVPSPQVHANAHGLLQIFLNLSQNSLRAVEGSESPALQIHSYASDDHATISFIDNGRGVENAALLFQPFRPEANGSGLGLFISRTLVKTFGGHLSFVPTESGCRFDVVLLRQVDRS